MDWCFGATVAIHITVLAEVVGVERLGSALGFFCSSAAAVASLDHLLQVRCLKEIGLLVTILSSDIKIIILHLLVIYLLSVF